MKKITITSAALSLALCGCGGGGSTPIDVSSLPKSGATVSGSSVPPTTTLIQIQPGDTWIYDVTGRITTDSSSQTLSGVMVRSVSQETLNGQPALKIVERTTYTPTGGVTQNSLSIRFFTQDPTTGALTQIGKQEGLFLFDVNSNTFVFPGAFSSAVSAAGQTAFINDVTSENCDSNEALSAAVTSKNDVKTPAGLFGTWKMEGSNTFRSNYTGVLKRIDLGNSIESGTVLSVVGQDATTEYWDPSTGSFVYKILNETTTTDAIKDVTQTNPTIIFTKTTTHTTTSLNFVLHSKNVQ